MLLQLARERGGGGDAGVAGKARGKIGQQGPRDTRGSAPGGGDPCDLQGGGGCFWSKGRVVGQARGDYVERFAVALQQQQPLDIVFGEPSEVAWVAPGGDTAAQPALVVGCIAARHEPGLQALPSVDVRPGAHLSVGVQDLFVAQAQILLGV